MKRVQNFNIPVSPAASFFPGFEISNKPKPLYLFAKKDNMNNQLLFLVTDSDDHCWIKKDLDGWKELKIEDFLLVRDGGSRTYCFKKNSDVRSLDIPFRGEAYCTLMDKSEIILENIPLSSEELNCQAIPNLEGLDLTSIPKTRAETQQRLALDEEKQKISTEIQKREEIIIGLGRIIETIKTLNEPDKKSIDSLTHQIKCYEQQKDIYKNQMTRQGESRVQSREARVLTGEAGVEEQAQAQAFAAIRI